MQALRSQNEIWCPGMRQLLRSNSSAEQELAAVFAHDNRPGCLASLRLIKHAPPFLVRGTER